MKFPNLRHTAGLARASRASRRFYRTYAHVSRDVAFHPELDVRLDVYAQAAGAGHPVLVFIHGGRWRDFRKELFAGVAARLLTEGLVIVIPDHTPYPQVAYERMAREVAAAVGWTLDNAARHGGDPQRVVVAGPSSGGHLAGLAALDGRFLRACGHSGGELGGLIGFSGVYDLAALYACGRARDDRDMAETILGVAGGAANLAAASPISHAARDCPPTLLIHGGADETVPVEQATAFHAALRAAGARSELTIYPGRGHSDILLSAMDEDRPQVVVDIATFVHAQAPTP